MLNCLWNVIYRKRMSLLQLKSMHLTGKMNNMIWTCNITQYLISVHYTYHASLYSWEIYTLYMIHIVQVKHPLQKFTDKKIYKNINIKRDITLVGNCCHLATGCLHDYIHFTIYHLSATCSVLWISGTFCNISQNMHSKAPVAGTTWKDQQSGLDM